MSKYIIENFQHSMGGHCESTTMRDLIVHAGIKITEEMVFGLDSSFGFSFFDNSEEKSTEGIMSLPLFIGGKQASIGNESLACRILGLNISIETFSSPEAAWASSKKAVNQNIPLGLQVDMGYLSYFNWEEELHFGGHFITLIGYDEDKHLVYVLDREFDEVQKTTLKELKAARSSTFGTKFLHPQNKQIKILKRSDGKKPPFSKAVKLALQQVATQFLSPSTNRQGIPAMILFAESVLKWGDILEGTMQSPFTNKIVERSSFTIEMIYGLIEEMGTGGAIFRNLYSNFLKELLNHPEINSGINSWTKEEIFFLEDVFENLLLSAWLWDEFSINLKTGLDKDRKNCLKYIDLDKLKELITEIISLEEACFRNLLQIKL